MFVAIIVSVLTFLIALVVVVLVLVRRHRNRTTTVNSLHKPSVQSIETVGVSSSLPEDSNALAQGTRQPSTTGKIGESLRSRFVALGVLAAAIFGALGARLWTMQILSSDHYRSEAEKNRYATVSTPAPRGYIYDANGIALVKNRATHAVLAEAEVIENHDVIQRLSAVLGIPYNVVRARLQDTSSGAQSQRVIAPNARLRDIAFIAEHSDAFPGVSVQERATREYPYGALCAHVVGYTGSISEEELAAKPKNREVELGDDVGKSGIEATYDNVLAGQHGQRVVVADTQGNVVEVVSETAPLRGSDVYLTIWAPVQYVAENALASLIAPEGIIGEGTGVAGACVVMDVRDGSLIALASYPTYAPATFTGGVTQDTWDLYSTEQSYYPLLNRAISGTYPAASTFKAFTGLAGLKYGFADTDRTWNCTGSWDGFNSGDVQKCWLRTGHGTINFHDGIVKSCDIVFYDIAYQFFFAGESQGGTISDTAMQEEIARFGFGASCGIDIAGEEVGRIPSPSWKAEHWKDVPTAGQWMGGDLTNTVIGQGDVLVTPLQVACAYGAIATGNLVRPHLLREVRNDTDTPAITYEPEIVATPEVDANDLRIVRNALHGVAANNALLSAAFEEAGLNVDDVACKTGTGEVAGKEDYAWFVCYMPFDDPQYVAAVLIEQGGGGAATAGPLGAKLMAATFAAERGELSEVSALAGSTGESVEYKGTSSGRTD